MKGAAFAAPFSEMSVRVALSLCLLSGTTAVVLTGCESDKYGFGETRGLVLTKPNEASVNLPPPKNPNDAESWFQYGFTFQAKQMWPEAIYCYKKTCELEKNKKNYWNGLGTAYQFCDKLESARAAFLKAHELDVYDMGPMLSIGFADTRQGKRDAEAERFYLMCLAVNPDQKEPWQNLIAVLHRLDEDDMMPLVQKLSDAPNSPNAAHIADLLNENYLKKFPDDYDALVNKGVFNTRVLNIPLAKDCFEKALKIKPNGPRALIGQGLLYDAIGDSKRAKEILDLCCQSSPSQAMAWTCRGAIAAREGDYKTALKCYTIGSSLSPENALWSEKISLYDRLCTEHGIK